MLLPAVLACCAAAAGFVFDEPAGAVVAVTPRGAGWRRTPRLAVAVVPVLAWGVVGAGGLVAWRMGLVTAPPRV